MKQCRIARGGGVKLTEEKLTAKPTDTERSSPTKYFNKYFEFNIHGTVRTLVFIFRYLVSTLLTAHAALFLRARIFLRPSVLVQPQKNSLPSKKNGEEEDESTVLRNVNM